NGVSLAQGGEKRREFAIRNGSMVLDFAHPGARRQQLVEVATPTSWIFAVAIAANLGKIQNTLNTPPQPACRFGLRAPDRFQHFEHEAGVNILYRQATYLLSMSFKRRSPLRCVLFVAPSSAVGSDVRFGALFEGDSLCCFEALSSALGAPRSDRV